MFSKDTYRQNREAGQRGQGAYPTLIAGVDTTPASSLRGLGLRKKPRDRTFTSPAHGRLFQVRALVHDAWLKREKRREAAR